MDQPALSTLTTKNFTKILSARIISATNTIKTNLTPYSSYTILIDSSRPLQTNEAPEKLTADPAAGDQTRQMRPTYKELDFELRRPKMGSMPVPTPNIHGCRDRSHTYRGPQQAAELASAAVSVLAVVLNVQICIVEELLLSI